MKLHLIPLYVLLSSTLLSETLSSKKNPFHFGFELSELMQNKFSNLGVEITLSFLDKSFLLIHGQILDTVVFLLM